MEYRITDKTKAVFLWCVWASLPWISIRLLLHFPYSHRILFFIVEPFRYKFSDISQCGLWILSLVLCFAIPVEAMLTGKRRYYLASACSLLFYVGHVGSEDARKAYDLQKQKLDDMDYRIKQMPADLTMRMKEALSGLKENPPSKNDIKFFINDVAISDKHGNPAKVDLKSREITLILRNESGKTLRSAFIGFGIKNCPIYTKNSGWENKSDNIIFYKMHDVILSGMPLSFQPPFSVECHGAVPIRGAISLYAEDVPRIDYNFTIVPGDN